MKQLIFFLLFITGISSARAQAEHTAYLGSELNLGNYFGADLSLNYVYLEKYSFKAGYSANLRKARSRPHDYSSGLVGAMLFGLTGPVDELETFSIAAGRIYKLNESGTIRANLSIGLGLTNIKEPENWKRSEALWLVENYTYDYVDYNTLSLLINPKIEFPFSRFYGFTVSPFVQVNKDRIFVGIGLGQMLGLLRERREGLYR